MRDNTELEIFKWIDSSRLEWSQRFSICVSISILLQFLLVQRIHKIHFFFITEESKPESAKTVTLTSNGSVLISKENNCENTNEETKDLEDAAVKIQAAFRGHQTRKNMKQPGKHEETEPTQQELEQEFHADDQGKVFYWIRNDINCFLFLLSVWEIKW